MGPSSSNNKQARLITKLARLWKDEQDHILLASAVRGLDVRYDLSGKIANEPGVEEIIQQMFGRLANSFGKLSAVRGKNILDIACGSSTSKAPASLHVDTPFGKMRIGRTTKGYTAQFEPWFCRILFELGAEAVGIDLGDLVVRVLDPALLERVVGEQMGGTSVPCGTLMAGTSWPCGTLLPLPSAP